MQCVGKPTFGGACKACVACRVNHAAQWAVRGAHERLMHDTACSITLTYNRNSVMYPWSGLQKKHLQDFFKRFRRRLEYYDMPGQLFKYMACGEYGEFDDGSPDFSHPHYHVVIFGFDFEDKYFWRTGKLGHKLYRSDLLEGLWPFGNCEIGGAEDEMINYVSSYILKKISGEKSFDHYAGSRVCDVLGNQFDFLYNPEFFLSSKRPAIGLSFLEKYVDDVFSRDEVIVSGKRRPVPDYYLRKLREKSELFYTMIKHERHYNKLDNFEKIADGLLPHRKIARQTVFEARGELFK